MMDNKDYRSKRAFNIILVIATLPLLVPIFILSSIFIFFQDLSSPIFTQIRTGFNRKPFKIYKLRTMPVNNNNSLWADGDSDYLFGASIIRKMRIDEIPQILNIIKGEMAIVGPRPEVPEMEVNDTGIKRYFDRYYVTPGIAGISQYKVGYVNNKVKLRKMIACDLLYIKRQSIVFDIKVIFNCICSVLR